MDDRRRSSQHTEPEFLPMNRGIPDQSVTGSLSRNGRLDQEWGWTGFGWSGGERGEGEEIVVVNC